MASLVNNNNDGNSASSDDDGEEIKPYGEGMGYEDDFLAADLGGLNFNQEYSEEEEEEDDDEEDKDDDGDDDDLTSSSEDDDEDIDDADLEGLGDDGDGVIEDEVPAYSCLYCGIHSPDSVAQCVDTGKWFCNARLNNSAACIIQHLVRSKKQRVRLHEDGPLGDSTIECYNCGNANVFNIGSLPTKGQDVVVLLCRVCLGETGALKEQGWEVDRWSALVQDKEFVGWLLKVPSEKEQTRARQVTTSQIRALEDLWRKNPNATMEDIKREGQTDDGPSSIQAHYEDAYEYQNIFGPLVKLEADEDKKMKEAQTQSNVSIKWEKSISKKYIARFHFKDIYGHISTDFRLGKGDELTIKLSAVCSGTGKPWEGSGYVLGIRDDGEVSLELAKGSPLTMVKDGYTIEFVWKSVSFDRMQNALKSFALESHSVSGYLYHQLLGHENIKEQIIPTKLPKRLKAPGLPTLNPSQEMAIRNVMQEPLSLIQGPPGTGKTVTSATLVYFMVRRNQKLEKKDGVKRQILVSAPSNVAVDQLVEKLHKAGLNVVRLAAKSREEVASSVDFLCLHTMVPAANPAVAKLLQLKKEIGDLTKQDYSRLYRERRRTELDILNLADVICCTCVGAGDPRVLERSMKRGKKRRRFEQVLIDEATQGIEPETMIPIVTGAKQLVMVGDHQQLPPVVLNKIAAKAGLGQSLFERLVLRGQKANRLTIQYRMHPCLSVFPSNSFYEGELQNGVSASERQLKKVKLPFPRPDRPMFFYCVEGVEEVGSTGTSYLNREEAYAVEKIVTGMLRGGIRPEQIGIITPYHAQRSYVSSYMARNGVMQTDLYDDIEVASVDAFQGREKDLIILSCVRSNEKQGIGFLKDQRRLNVALTRAKYGLIILGNPKVLSTESLLWYNLLQHFRLQELLMEGPLVKLRPSLINLKRPDTGKKHWQNKNYSYKNYDNKKV